MMTTAAHIELDDNGHLILSGTLNLQTVVALHKQADILIAEVPELVFDFSKVDCQDSASVAVLTRWMRTAKESGKPIRFESIPEHVHSMVALYGLPIFE